MERPAEEQITHVFECPEFPLLLGNRFKLSVSEVVAEYGKLSADNELKLWDESIEDQTGIMGKRRWIYQYQCGSLRRHLEMKPHWWKVAELEPEHILQPDLIL